MKKFLIGDWLAAGEILVIGLAAAAHLAGVFLGWPFSRCVMLLGGLTGMACVCGAGVCFLAVKRRAAQPSCRESGGSAGKEKKRHSRTEILLWVVFAAAAAAQLIFICVGDTAYRVGDMTVETVASFLEQDGIYRVNPMTGAPYTEGMPSRLKILCLPTLYGSLCRLTGLPPETVVHTLVPIVTLFSSYTVFGLVAVSLFPEEKGGNHREKRVCFMTVVSLLIWAGAYQYGMDGFNLLCCGWRGVTIRNLVFLPWILSLCLRGKWLTALLCIPGEACIVWTLYGCGVCLPLLAGMAAARWCCGRFFRHRPPRESLPITRHGGGTAGGGESPFPARSKEKGGGRDGGVNS